MLLTIHSEIAGQVRTESLMGRTYRVIPAVLVRSQVLLNNLGATFLPPEEISAEWADTWNSIPVIAGGHPTRRGQAVSARAPALLNVRGVGFVFAAEAVTETAGRRLRAEVWLDEGRASVVPEFQAILERLDSGLPVELSTGFPTQVDEVVGVYNGQQYTQVLRPSGADHLAVFVSGVGACSVVDGCGLGVNHSGACVPLSSTQEDISVEKTTDVIPSAVNAEEGETPTEAPGSEMPVGGDAGGDAGGDEGKPGLFNRALASLKKAFGLDAQNVEGIADEDKRRILERALQAQLAPSPQAEAMVTSVFSDEGVVVFWWSTPQGAVPPGELFFQVGFALDAAGNVTFGGTPVQVRRRVTFDPVVVAGNQEPGVGSAPSIHEEDVTMDRKALIAALALVGPLDAENLAKLSDCQLKALHGGTEGGASPTEGEGTLPEVATLQEEAANLKTEIAEMKTVLEAVNAKLGELTSVTAPVVAEQERERAELLTQLSGNARVTNVYAKEELEAMPTESLRKMASLSRGESYAGRGGPKADVTNTTEPKYMEPVPYWETKADRKEVTV